ncbi:HAMP domain-containing histidine kinase [Pleurocapsales cyanobacterium LEGE 10410]|nr:HAMP domain-containing histidine kinase [Pleurocapsales cyanobacterium LEGE 10410]
MALGKVNLLIVADRTTDIEAIAASLDTVEIDYTYDLVIEERLAELPQGKYGAILYNYAPSGEHTINSLIEKLQYWYHLYPHAPLILVTEPLGDEQAVKLIQSGISSYVLKHKLHRLPKILAETLFNFASHQAIATQQEELIKQQQQKIQQLEAQKQSWQEGEQAQQEHISHLVHELRNPISAIIGFAGMLKEQYYGSLNPKQMQYASLLHSSGEHLLALVKNYLEIAKIDANKQSLDLERIAVVEICQAAIYIVTNRAEKKGLELNYELEGNIDFCTADSLRIKQILINLLSNAIKFTNQGSVTLQVTLRDGQLYFAVTDTGVGISEENIAKLFKPFPQISNHHDSTGLGLTLSKKLAQLHGGDITITSELGKGSCFTLRIPQHQDASGCKR